MTVTKLNQQKIYSYLSQPENYYFAQSLMSREFAYDGYSQMYDGPHKKSLSKDERNFLVLLRSINPQIQCANVDFIACFSPKVLGSLLYTLMEEDNLDYKSELQEVSIDLPQEMLNIVPSVFNKHEWVQAPSLPEKGIEYRRMLRWNEEPMIFKIVEVGSCCQLKVISSVHIGQIERIKHLKVDSLLQPLLSKTHNPISRINFLCGRGHTYDNVIYYKEGSGELVVTIY